MSENVVEQLNAEEIVYIRNKMHDAQEMEYFNALLYEEGEETVHEP